MNVSKNTVTKFLKVMTVSTQMSLRCEALRNKKSTCMVLSMNDYLEIHISFNTYMPCFSLIHANNENATKNLNLPSQRQLFRVNDSKLKQ